MPKLLAFLACEKVIIDQEQNPTLISVLQNVNVVLPPTDSKIPEDAVSPQTWTLFAIWDREPADVGKRFRQRFVVTRPDGEPLPIQGQLDFDVKDELSINYINIIGFPVGRAGTVSVKTWLESLEGSTLSPSYVYPMTVRHLAEPPKRPVKP